MGDILRKVNTITAYYAELMTTIHRTNPVNRANEIIKIQFIHLTEGLLQVIQFTG